MKIHHLIADSVEAPGPVWVRFPGLDEAWTVSIVPEWPPRSGVLSNTRCRTFPTRLNRDSPLAEEQKGMSYWNSDSGVYQWAASLSVPTCFASSLVSRKRNSRT